MEKFKTTIFTHMVILVVKHNDIKLEQCFLDIDGPEFVKDVFIQEIREGKNQYARGYGVLNINYVVVTRFKDTCLMVYLEKDLTHVP